MKIIKQFLMIIISVSILVMYFLIKMDMNTNDAVFVSCIDGDTAILEMDGKEEKVRFLAIDAMELNESYGKEASNYVCNTLKNASRITLEFEEDSYRDKYNRVLAWVFVDDKLLQDDLVSKGLAKVKYIYDDYKYVDRLLVSQEKAKSERNGLWGVENE